MTIDDRERLNRIRLYAQDALDNGWLSGGAIGNMMAIRDEVDALLSAPPVEIQRDIREFAAAILHGDDEHRGWLLEAAEEFIAGRPMPAPRGGGSKPVEIQREAVTDAMLDRAYRRAGEMAVGTQMYNRSALREVLEAASLSRPSPGVVVRNEALEEAACETERATAEGLWGLIPDRIRALKSNSSGRETVPCHVVPNGGVNRDAASLSPSGEEKP